MADKRNRKLVPDNIAELTPYKAGKTIAEVREAYRPARISKLASNENRLGFSPRVDAAVKEALNEIQDYPDPIARKLRARIADHNEVKPENVMIAGGSESIIAILCRTFFLEDEEILTADATFVGIYVHAGIQGVKVSKVPLTDEYRFDLEAMADRITDKTKMIYIANPNNPTGTYITRDQFESFIKKVPDDVIVIMDEAYWEFARHIDDFPNSLDYRYDKVLTLRTFSKAYGLAGFRIGYALGHDELIGQLLKTKLTFEPTALAQAAALAAFEDTEFLDRSIAMVESARQRLYDFFDNEGIEYVRSSSNSVMMILPDEQEAIDFTQAMLEKGVILRRVDAFGLPNCIRITVGTDREMDHLEQSIREYRSERILN